MTLWTDCAFPVITFNVYLTGYDVQSISLFVPRAALRHRGSRAAQVRRGIDATALGNGCSPEVPPSEMTVGDEPIGPRP